MLTDIPLDRILGLLRHFQYSVRGCTHGNPALHNRWPHNKLKTPFHHFSMFLRTFVVSSDHCVRGLLRLITDAMRTALLSL